MTPFFYAEGGPIWIKFRRLAQNDMSTAVMSKSTPDAEFQYGGRLGEFNGMSSQSHLPHCRVLSPGDFAVMIPELHATLQGAATWRIQWPAIPEPRVTLQGRPTATWWIRCHDPRATCHVAVTRRNQSHDRATLQGVRIPSVILKIVFRHLLFFNFDERWLSYRLRYTC